MFPLNPNRLRETSSATCFCYCTSHHPMRSAARFPPLTDKRCHIVDLCPKVLVCGKSAGSKHHIADPHAVQSCRIQALGGNIGSILSSDAIAQPASPGCSSRVWVFPTSILQRKKCFCIDESIACRCRRCIYVCPACECYEASQCDFQI